MRASRQGLRALCLVLVVAGLAVVSKSLAAEPAKETAAQPVTRQPAEANTCLGCHLTLSEERLSRVAEEFQTSVHKDERIGCVGCHGGTPTDPTVRAHDPERGFVARPARDTLDDLCGDCHADPVFIRQFNARLPVDQKKLFELSMHGKLVSASDPKAPTCSDCHGVHGILPVDSENAPVHPSHVVELCAGCHANSERMKSYGTPTDQLQKWRASSHGVAFRNGNHKAPTCTGCHSPHAGTLSTFSAAALCGRCHEEQRRLFSLSPHVKPFRKLGLAECVPCHGDHGVSDPSWLLGMGPEAACSRCHARSDKGARVATAMANMLARLDRRAHGVETRLKEAQGRGLRAPDATLALAKVKSGRVELAVKVHDLNVEHLALATDRLEELTGAAERAIQKSKRARVVEVRGYYAAIFVCGLLFVLLVWKSVRLARERAGRER